MKDFGIWLLCGILLLCAMMIAIGSGCAAAKPQPVKPTPALTHPGQTPPELKHVATGLDWIIVISVIAVGVGIGLYFFAPVAHSLAFAVAGTAASIEGAALVTRVSLWFIPWIALGLGVLAGGVLLYEAWKNRVTLEEEFYHTTGAKPLGSTGSIVLPTPVTLTHT